MDSALVPLILGMAAVTYGPRLAPFLFIRNSNMHPFWDGFLKCIPVAAIGALIFPAAGSATPDFPLAGLTGMVFALAYGLWKGGIIIPVLGAVGVAYMMLFIQ
jgi:branched-subunit amino acid transport protein